MLEPPIMLENNHPRYLRVLRVKMQKGKSGSSWGVIFVPTIHHVSLIRPFRLRSDQHQIA